MNYDQRQARGDSLIAFIRRVDSPNKPYVTVEVELKTGRIAQRYGDHDTKPSEEVIAFLEIWQKKVFAVVRKANRTKQKQKIA